MKKTTFLLVFLSCLWMYLGLGVFVVQAATILPSYYDWSSTLEVKQSKVLGLTSLVQFNRYVLGGELTPASPFYFIKPLQESVQLIFTFDQKAKDELRVQIAGERLDEIQKLATSDNIQAITTAADAYYRSMTAVSNDIASIKGGNVNDVLSQVEQETAKHDVILEQVRVQVPDQAEEAIDMALEASWKGTDTVADLKDRPAVPPDLVSRLQSLKAQGLLTPEEVNKLVSVKSRVEAREEVGKYVNEGIVSQSDFMRLNETSKSFYPDEYYKIHETLRFQEMQKLEDQKPDDSTLNKIQSFAKTYNPGDQVPAELRRYWVPVVRLEEIQNTLRPDLVDASLFKQNDQELKKFNEVVERFKPRPEDVANINSFILKNKADVNNLPPEYQRMYNLGQKYGAACGSGFNWVPESQSPAGGYCTPNGSGASGGLKYDDFAKGKTCNGGIVNARNSNGSCSAFTADCIPPGWNKTDTCVATPANLPAQGQSTNTRISCPSNAHFVSVSYDPNGGYCIPNYTQVGFDQSTGTSGLACPASSHRSYAGGPCVPDYNISTFSNPYSLPSLTTTPGGPYYTGSGRCGANSNWVPEPINPQGGYCAPTSGTGDVPGGTGTSRESQEAACRAGGGTCVSWVNGACGCERSGSGGPASNPATYGSPSRESQEAACRAGGGTCRSWNNGACGCEYSGSGNTGASSYGSPSRESQEAACRSGGGTCVSWVNGACGCERVPNTGSNPSNPPAGYGSCPSGQYWNGSGCQNSDSPEEAPVPTSSPASNPPQESAPPPPAPLSDPAGACSQTSGCSWTGSACQCGSQ